MTGPIDQPWNVREVSIIDPDGYRLVFTVPVNTGLGFNNLLEKIRKS